MSLPPPVIKLVGRFYVVRDDLILGGTKVRYMLPLLEGVRQRSIVYAGPCQGYAQIALAHVCRMLGKRAVIFVAKRKTPHPRTLQAKQAGALVYQVPFGRLNVVQARARRFAQENDAMLVPFGVDVPEALAYFAGAARQIGISPKEVWACSGSGALIRGLQQAWPLATFHAVKVGNNPNIGRARLWVAPEKFEEPARMPPPYPSADNYDAKIWQFVTRHGSDGALIWNVGS